MSIWQSMFLGFIQGITEFLPVSSFGHLLLAQGWMGITGRTAALPEAVLHLGTALSVLLCFQRDFLRILKELLEMLIELAGNVHIWFYNRRNPEDERPFARIVTAAVADAGLYTMYGMFSVVYCTVPVSKKDEAIIVAVPACVVQITS